MAKLRGVLGNWAAQAKQGGVDRSSNNNAECNPDDVKPGSYLFISYSRQDSDSMNEIRGILDRNGYSYWYDSGIKSGKIWMEEISMRIKECCQFMLLVSNSAQRSSNVNDEIYLAKQSNKPFVIIYLEDVELLSGIDLMIGRMQGIMRSKFASKADFENRLCMELSTDAKIDHEKISIENETNYKSVLSNLETDYEIIKELSARNNRRTFVGKSKATKLLVFIKQYTFSNYDTESSLLFENEKYALTTCQSPYMPYLIDVNACETGGFLVESFVSGRRLSKVNSLTPLEAIHIGLKLTDAVACLHRNNIVHCDIKPDNAVISSYGDVYLLDFDTSRSTTTTSFQWSRGTPGFAAPEQYDMNYHPDVRTDFYGLGRTIEYILNPVPIIYSNSCDDEILEACITHDAVVSKPTVSDNETVLISGNQTTSLYGKNQYTTEKKTIDLPPILRKLLDRMTDRLPCNRPANCSELIKEMNKCRIILELEGLIDK